MIGTNVRGLRHLWRLSDSSLKEILINFRDYGNCFCHVMKTDAKSPCGERLIIFNSHYNFGKRSIGECCNQMFLSRDDINFISMNYSRVIDISKPFSRDISAYIYDITMLPDNFEKEYNEFLSSNSKMVSSLMNKYNYNSNHVFSKCAYMYTNGSKNFYQWAIGTYFQNGTSMSSIRRIMSWNEIYGQLSKNLNKNTITAYTSNKDMVSLLEELVTLRRDKRINDVINMFNTTQKRILRAASVDFSDKVKEIMSKFYRLSDTKKVNFVRKMSTIEDFDEIIRQMRHITSTHFDWNKESFIDFIKNVDGMNYETIYDNGDIVLVKVEDFETVKNLAKTTNWCISKNKTYWNNYIEHRNDSTQYMVFDFSKKEDDLLSIVGFTTEYNRGITHAHDFSNNDIMKTNDAMERQFLKSFITKFSNENNIYSVLKNCGIDVNLVAKYEKPLYEWNKETMYKYLYECVNKGNVDILHDEGNLVVLSVIDNNVRYFLGDAYIDNIGNENWGNQHIIFMDFSISEYDPNRIQFAIIKTHKEDQEDFCYGIYNEHIDCVNTTFDTKLIQYGLPYDIIRRSDNIYIKISGAFNSYNGQVLKQLLKDADIKTINEAMRNYIGLEPAVSIIASSIVDSMSFDMLDAFYDNGIKLSSLLDSSLVNILVKDVTNCMVSHGRNTNYCIPTKEQIDRFFNNDCSSMNEAFYIGSYLVLKKIIKMEKGAKKPNNIYRRLTSIITMTRKKGDIFEELLMDIADQLNFSEGHDTISSWVNYAYLHGSDEMKDYAKKNVLIYTFPNGVWESIKKHTSGNCDGQRPVYYRIHDEDLGIRDIDEEPDHQEDDGDDFEFLGDEDEEFIGDENDAADFDEIMAEEEVAPAEAF